MPPRTSLSLGGSVVPGGSGSGTASPSSLAAVAALVAVNLLPLVGVAFFGWSLHALLLVYWLESGVVGALNVPRILLASGQGEAGMTATVNGRPVDLSGPDPAAVVDGPRLYPQNLPIAGFFVMHYGIFWVVHGVFVLFGLPMFAGGLGSLGGVDVAAVALGGVAMLASHGGSFVANYLGRAEYRDVSPGAQMGEPYRRVVVLHLTIVFGAFLVSSLGSSLALVALLVVLKTGIDLAAHLREHRRAAERAAGAGSAGAGSGEADRSAADDPGTSDEESGTIIEVN
mgnify:CR=1 FL=1